MKTILRVKQDSTTACWVDTCHGIHELLIEDNVECEVEYEEDGVQWGCLASDLVDEEVMIGNDVYLVDH